MRIVHLMASPFYGGPERQMLGLAKHLPREVESVFVSFAERGLAEVFLEEARHAGFEAIALRHNVPRLLACIREIADELLRLKADLLCTSGYKPDVLGWRAARRAGIPVVSISHGWTGATWRVRGYEKLDKIVLRWMDAVVCVSKAQADKARAVGVPNEKLTTIQNGIGDDAFVEADPAVRAEMLGYFAQRPRWLIGAAGRLSPEKGFGILIEAAALVVQNRPDAAFVLFGEGPLRSDLKRAIDERGLQGRFVMAGFRKELGRFLPCLDLGVMSSFTEGLPVALLEMGAAGVPSVATAVGGIPEVIEDGVSGSLVPPGNASALAQSIIALLGNESQRIAMGREARDRVRRDFSFTAMSQRYHELFRRLTSGK